MDAVSIFTSFCWLPNSEIFIIKYIGENNTIVPLEKFITFQNFKILLHDIGYYSAI